MASATTPSWELISPKPVLSGFLLFKRITPANFQIGKPDRSGDLVMIAFSQRSSSPRLIQDETFYDSDIINNLIDWEDGHEESDSLRVE
ncbi:hypothetical protein TNCV_674891 [Trichonephila clavipes]|nr:hypothetical protein TNCV_674891 [Trichonephila clavipes]